MNKIIELVIDLEDFEFDDLGVEIMSLVDRPAIEVNWMAFKQEEIEEIEDLESTKLYEFLKAALDILEEEESESTTKKFWAFSEDEDQRIITGPAMLPGQLIPRKDELGNIFHVYFSEETIKNIAKKFMADSNLNNTDVNHDENVVQENTLLESWIVEDPAMDKSKALGFDVPKGTWMVSYKINNEETWRKIKAGELNGFSVEGAFLEKYQNI